MTRAMTRVIPRLLLVVLPGLIAPAVCVASTVSGQVVSSAGQPLSGVSINAWRGKDVVGSARTSNDGTYSVDVAASVSIVDYIVYELAAFLPKVVEGPLWVKADSRVNIVLLSSTISSASQPAALGAIHSVQFLQLIANRSDVAVPETLVTTSKLAVAVRCVSGPATGGGGGGGSNPERMKSVDRWGRDDDFFPVARSNEKGRASEKDRRERPRP